MELPLTLEGACKKGDIATVSDFISRDVSYVAARSYNGETPLHWACTSGNIDLVRMIVQKGGFVNTDNWRGTAPLIYAALSADIAGPEGSEVSVFLLECGADPRAVSGFSGRTPAMSAKNPDVRDLLNKAETRLNDAIEKDPRTNFRYRLSRWMNDSVLYLCIPAHIRARQYPPDYLIEPVVKEKYNNSGIIAAWKECSMADRRIHESSPDSCIRCGESGGENPVNQKGFCSAHCEEISRPLYDKLMR